MFVGVGQVILVSDTLNPRHRSTKLMNGNLTSTSYKLKKRLFAPAGTRWARRGSKQRSKGKILSRNADFLV